MKKLILNTVVLASLALVFATDKAQATTQTGEITGYVSDPSGLPVPDVLLELTGSTLIGGVRKTRSNEEGEFRFRELTPGPYVVVATHDLYRSARMEQIRVAIGRNTTVDIILEPPVLEDTEVYVVRGRVPVVDTQRTTLGGSISESFTETVPTSRDYQGVAQLVAGVDDVDGDGNANIHGATDNGNQYLLDGINITDPVTNTFSNNFNFDAIQDVEVLTAGRDAEYGSAVGGVINIVTKSGGNAFSADSSLYYQSSLLQWRDRGEENLNNQGFQFNLNLGGPIIKDRLWFFVSGEVPWFINQLPATEENVFPDQDGQLHPTREYRGFAGLAKLTWQPLSNQTFKLLMHGDPATIFNEDQQQTIHPDAETQRYQGGVVVSLTSETFVTPELFIKNQIAYSHSRLYLYPQSNDFDLAGRINDETGTSTVNSTTWNDENRTRIQLHSSVSYSLDDLLGKHQLKAGIDASFSYDSVFNSLPGGGYYRDNGLVPGDASSMSGAGLPFEYTRVVEAQDTFIWGDTEGLFVQDVWAPVKGLTIRPGLRFDSSRMRNYQDEIIIHINTLSPRIGLSWDPFDDQKTALRVGYYQYVDTGYLSLSDFVGKGLSTRTYEYNPTTQAYDIFSREEGGENGVIGKDYLTDAFDQKRPKTHEFIVGGSRELADDLSLSVDLIYRYSGNMWEDDEVNLQWNQDGDDVIGFNNGQQQWIFSLGAPDEAFIRYYGVEASLAKRFSNKWEMIGSYTWSWTEGTEAGYITYALDNPRQAPYEFGFLPHDRRHALKIYTSYRLPYGFVIGGRLRYESGTPYDRLYLNNYYGSYDDRRAPRGFDRTEDGSLVELRYPDVFSINTRLTWQLQELTGQKLDLIVDVFNLLNARTPVTYEQRNLPTGGATQFGDVLDKLSPLNVQLGIRYRY